MAFPDAARAVQAQLAADRGAVAAQPLERCVYGRERAAGRLIEGEALGGRAQRARAALEEARARMRLEIAQQLADGRLRHAEIGGGRRHRAALDDADKSAEGGGDVHA